VPASAHRKGYTAVRKDFGKPGIGPKVIPLFESGSLTKYGYAIKKSVQARHVALSRAIKKYGALSVFRKLKAQETLRKRTQPKARAIFAADAEWVQAQYSTSAGFTS